MDTVSLVKAWFKRACEQMHGNVQGCVYLGEANTGPYNCIEVSADSYTVNELVKDNINAVIQRRKSIVSRIGSAEASQVDSQRLTANGSNPVTGIDSKNYLVTCPILIDRQLLGAVSIEFKHDSNAQNNDYLQQLENAVKWLSFLLTSSSDVQAVSQDARLALQIAALSLTHKTSNEAAAAVVTELATNLSCERVSVCFMECNELKLFALSHSARYESKQNLIKTIEAAGDEAVVQKETLVYPVEGTSSYMLQAHSELAKNYNSDFICTVPLIHDERVIGSIVFERVATAAAFDEETVELCEQLASLFAPVLEYRRLNDRPFSIKAKETLNSMTSDLFGRGYLGFKFSIVSVVMVLLLFTFMSWEYKISSNAVLEGTVERVITAPEEGYIKQAKVRPGDVVTMSQVLASLDDRDLQLEKLKWSSKKKQIAKEYREALASRNKSQIGILRARRDQAQAQMEILNKKLERTVISAPIGGVIVSGDFTQALGSPVERGQILYTISPLDHYRVLLDVDESDIAEIKVGMKGELTLSAEADETYEIVIEKITPVSVSGDGINYFKVEAALIDAPTFLRPGMQGVSKVSIGDRQLLWIWTHKMVDWIRLQLWSWW